MEILQDLLVKRQQGSDMPVRFVRQLDSRQCNLGSGESAQNALACRPGSSAIGLPFVQPRQSGLAQDGRGLDSEWSLSALSAISQTTDRGHRIVPTHGRSRLAVRFPLESGAFRGLAQESAHSVWPVL